MFPHSSHQQKLGHLCYGLHTTITFICRRSVILQLPKNSRCKWLVLLTALLINSQFRLSFTIVPDNGTHSLNQNYRLVFSMASRNFTLWSNSNHYAWVT